MINKNDYQYITSKIEEASEGSLVFYYIWNRSSAEKLLKSLETKSGVTVVTNFDPGPSPRNQFIVLDSLKWREEKARLAQAFYPFKENLVQFAVTGTNGKTTTCFLGMLLASKHWNKNSMYIGTLGIYINGEWVQTNDGFTTPDIIDYRQKVQKYQERVDCVWVEASSHGLDQGRLDGITFDGVGWTSFSQDHLDYHKDMKSYLEAKLNVFNIVKDNGAKLLGAHIPELEKAGHQFQVAQSISAYPEYSFLKIEYNQNNFNLAYRILEKEYGQIHKDFLSTDIYEVPGRFQIVQDNKREIVIDYAHTPDALKKLILQCKKIWSNKKILTLIGCGGDRDRKKRPMMAEVASRLSDYCYFTEDNPRSEKAEDICREMVKDIKKDNWEIILNRPEAIELAMNKYSEAVIVIAGKGEETFIDRGYEKFPHKDKEFVESLI